MNRTPILLLRTLGLYSAVALLAAIAYAHASAGSQTANVSNIVLSGKIVTMNASRDVLNHGLVWVKDGLIVAVAGDRASLELAATNPPPGIRVSPADLKSAARIDTAAVIYPGLIDLHNHPEYAIYPLLPIKRRYKDRYEWRFYDDDYARRITNPNIVLTRAHYLNLQAEMGRYGEIRALVGGTTTLQGSRPELASSQEECLVRNIERAAITSRSAFSRVDIGRDAAEWKAMTDETARGTLVVHLAEGVGPRMSDEFEYVKRSGLLGPGMVVVHGVGLSEAQFREMASAGSPLVWSPLSNLLLYGQTTNIDAARRAGVQISLAPDWGPSGSKSILGELKVADLVNRHALKMPFSDIELVEMVTSKPAAALGWQHRLGSIAVGQLADLVVIASGRENPYRNLIAAIEEDITLVLVRGEALYGEAVYMRQLRNASELEALPPVAGKAYLIAPNCPGTNVAPMSVEATMARIQQGLTLDPALLAKRMPAEQVARDLALCGVGKPDDPPSIANLSTLLQCRFQLPFETTTLSPLYTSADPDYFPRLLANPNIPAYLRALPDYYRPPQGAKRSSSQAPSRSPSR